MRHFQVVNVPEPTEETLTLIFESILGGFFNFKKANERLKPSVAERWPYNYQSGH